MDVQYFDLKAAESIRTNPAHQEISAMQYASPAAAGAALSMIIAPLFHARLPIVTDRGSCSPIPGRGIDVLGTQRGVAVNPKNQELMQRLKDGGLPLVSIDELKTIGERIIGTSRKAGTPDVPLPK